MTDPAVIDGSLWRDAQEILARHDLNSLRTLPGWRLDYGRTSPLAGWQRPGNNRKAF